MSDADRDEVTVSNEQVEVRKSLDTDQFETMAVVFDIHSKRDGPARVQVIDAIPEDVPPDDIGFHPDYGAEHWLIEDGVVVFEREFEPGEEFTTIYGVRGIEGSGEEFLESPEVELLDAVEAEAAADGTAAEPDALEEIVSEEHSQIVRDVISGEADTLPGLDDDAEPTAEAETEVEEAEPPEPEPEEAEPADPVEPEAEAEPVEAEPPEPEPEAEAEEAEPADPVEPEPEEAEPPEPVEPEPVEAEPPESEPEAEAAAGSPDSEVDDEADEPLADVEAAVREEFAEGGEPEPDAETDADVDIDAEAEDEAGADEIRVPVTGGVARVLVKELREGTVDPEDRRLLREELSAGEGSREARIRHLQSEVSDLAAYTDALEEFLDEHGTAEEIFGELRSEVEAVREEAEEAVEAVRGEVEEEVSGLRSEVEAVREEVAGLEDRLEATADDVEEVEAEVAGLREDLADVREEAVAEVESDLEDLHEEVAEVDTLEERLGTLEEKIGGVRADLDEMSEFRSRLISAVGNPDDESEG